MSHLLITLLTLFCLGNAPLEGSFVYLGDSADEDLPASELPAFFDHLQNLGMDTIIIQSTRNKTGTCAKGSFGWVKGAFPKLESIFDLAHEKGIAVYLGLVSSMHVCHDFYTSPNAVQVLKDTQETMAVLNSRFGKKKSLAGWYISDEPGQVESHYFTYYKNIVKKIRHYSSKPIVVSPYLKGVVGKLTPEELAKNALAFKSATNINIQAWQDSAGADGVVVKGSYFRALSSVLGKNALWGNIELFNWGKDLTKGGGYQSASPTRVREQLKQLPTDLASKRVSWLGQTHLKAGSLLAFGLENKKNTPVSYQYFRPLSKKYSDVGGELTNKLTAPPQNFEHPEWSGTLGEFAVIFDFGKEIRIERVGVHLLHWEAAGIKFPEKMTITCEDKGKGFVNETKLSIARDDSEYVLSNIGPLGAQCRMLKITLTNSGWTFVSEVEFFSLK